MQVENKLIATSNGRIEISILSIFMLCQLKAKIDTGSSINGLLRYVCLVPDSTDIYEVTYNRLSDFN